MGRGFVCSCVFMYTSMYLRTYVCMYVCMYEYRCVCKYACKTGKTRAHQIKRNKQIDILDQDKPQISHGSVMSHFLDMSCLLKVVSSYVISEISHYVMLNLYNMSQVTSCLKSVHMMSCRISRSVMSQVM